MTKGERVSSTLRSEASSHCILHWLYGYLLERHPCQDLVWHMETSAHVVCSSTLLLWLACAGNSTSVSDDTTIIRYKGTGNDHQNGNTGVASTGLHGHCDQYNMFELLHEIGFGMNLGFLDHIRSREMDWSPCES